MRAGRTRRGLLLRQGHRILARDATFWPCATAPSVRSPPPPRGGGGRPDRRRGPPPPPLLRCASIWQGRVTGWAYGAHWWASHHHLRPAPASKGRAPSSPLARALLARRGVSPQGMALDTPPSTNHRAGLEHYMRSQGLYATRQNPSPRQPTPSYPVLRCWLRNHRLPFTFPPPPLLTGASPHCGWGREPPQLGHHPFPLILFFFPLSSKACSSTLGSPAVSIFPPARRACPPDGQAFEWGQPAAAAAP